MLQIDFASKLLLDEQPIVIQPSLARCLGFNEAAVIQQLHFWQQKSNKFENDRYWVFNTYDEWLKQIPVGSKNTIIRIFEKLCADGIVIKDNYNKQKFDKTNWYSIDYDALNVTLNAVYEKSQTINPKWVDDKPKMGNSEQPKMGRPIPYIKTTTNIIKEIITYLNSSLGTNYRSSTPKTTKLIQSRLKEGFTLDEFKVVIDKKKNEWQGTDFETYLRPETLFGTKFETYLNQKTKGKGLGSSEVAGVDFPPYAN